MKLSKAVYGTAKLGQYVVDAVAVTQVVVTVVAAGGPYAEGNNLSIMV
jgi:NAD(P)H-dependent flavin oxidoreductase YrpB (nitropropane dioxygenase family)